jgi:signal transduction histidine kinase
VPYRFVPPLPVTDLTPLRAELDTLREIARALAAGTSFHEILQVLCEAAMSQGASSGASVAEKSDDSGAITVAAGIAEPLSGLRFPLGGSVTEQVAATRKPMAVTSATQTAPAFHEVLSRIGAGPILVLPLTAQQQLLGVLAVYRRAGEAAFDAADEARLAALADLGALALWKARLLEETRAADAAKTSLLAMLSHELRTPLAALQGYGELLEDEIVGPLTESQRDVITRLRSVSHHLAMMIEEVLTWASLEADRVTPHTAPVAVAELLDALHPIIEPLAREKGIAFRVECEPGLPEVATDEGRARQILLNLCQNAVKFTESGEVTVRASRGSPAPDGTGTLRIAVRDTGIGIAAEDLARLFRPFSQLADPAARRQRGTGLGLYISRRLATLLGGRIEVVSRPGEGSAFTLVLPVAR